MEAREAIELEDFQSQAEKEHWERHHAGKDPFPSEESANHFARMLHTGKIPTRHFDCGTLLDAYLCDYSEPGRPHWHLGHPL